MKNFSVLALFVLSLVGVAVTVDATTDDVEVRSAFELPASHVESEAQAEAEALENRRKKRDAGRGEEDEEELRVVADALRVLEAEVARSRGM